MKCWTSLVVWFTKQLYTQCGLVQVCPPRPQFTYSSFPLLTFAPEGIPRVLAPFLSVLPLRQHGLQHTCILDLWPKDVRIVSFPDHKSLRVPDSRAFESFWLCANHHHHGQYSLRFHIIHGPTTDYTPLIPFLNRSTKKRSVVARFRGLHKIKCPE